MRGLPRAWATGGKPRFVDDLMVRSASERRFEIMGAAAARVSDAFRESRPGVPWRNIISFRNLLIHGYDTLNPEMVWGVTGRPLSDALAALKALDV